jgi:hypothetical protein
VHRMTPLARYPLLERDRRRAIGPAGVVAANVLAVIALAVAILSAPQGWQDRSYPIRIALASSASMTVPGSAHSKPPLATPAASATISKAVSPSSSSVAADAESRPAATDGAQELADIVRMPATIEAVGRALTSGKAQAWSAQEVSGYAVAGPPQVAGRLLCRNVAVWAQADAGDGVTLPQLYCLAKEGGWKLVHERELRSVSNAGFAFPDDAADETRRAGVQPSPADIFPNDR